LQQLAPIEKLQVGFSQHDNDKKMLFNTGMQYNHYDSVHGNYTPISEFFQVVLLYSMVCA
jgi:hypothetical protein